jgi:hypothetical protein
MNNSDEKAAREFFQQEARKENISLRAYCKKYGIVYESFFGRDDIDNIPGKVYLSELLPRPDDNTEKSPYEDD